ncbi:hypothetical protein [Nocardia terpenica]|uniref:Uncharacterized protein n=1 Tax=Nocardia terpenica TaxID=455432 RepID=A0A164L9D5_9NOCA|nr:hypothetical protein [Nocardia terpenica]KZM72153.1 hypothetical protein AWN90_36345 [Nocardia terpenica]NQE86712.1 hypothetical protein [Nocardia terpenica]
MTTLADDGWIPVTSEQSGNGYRWRVWIDSEQQNFTFIEAFNEAGQMFSGGVGKQDVPDEGVRFWVGKDEGFPTFVGVWFDEAYPRMTIETTHRAVIIGAERTESHFGKRYYAMPLEEGEGLIAVVAGDVRKQYVSAPGIGSGETGFYPSDR